MPSVLKHSLVKRNIRDITRYFCNLGRFRSGERDSTFCQATESLVGGGGKKGQKWEQVPEGFT